MAGYMVQPSGHPWYVMVRMAWYMVWPGGHRMVYGMAWYMVWPNGQAEILLTTNPLFVIPPPVIF